MQFLQEMSKPEYLMNQEAQKLPVIVSEKIMSRPFLKELYFLGEFGISWDMKCSRRKKEKYLKIKSAKNPVHITEQVYTMMHKITSAHWVCGKCSVNG